MKWIHYTKFTGDDFGLTSEDLLKALSDFFLESGFQNQYMGFSEWNQHTLEDLKNALQRALEQGDTFDPDQAQRIHEQVKGSLRRLRHCTSTSAATRSTSAAM